jgi:hypothetical protein
MSVKDDADTICAGIAGNAQASAVRIANTFRFIKIPSLKCVLCGIAQNGAIFAQLSQS